MKPRHLDKRSPERVRADLRISRPLPPAKPTRDWNKIVPKVLVAVVLIALIWGLL